MNNAPKIDVDSFLLPHASSSFAEMVDSHFNAVLWVSIVFFTLVTTMALFFAVRYRRRRAGEVPTAPSHHTTLEVVWTAIPLVIVIALFSIGVRGYVEASVAPRESLEVQVSAQMYMWQFTYPDGTTTVNELGVPRGRPVKLLMSSKDVVHSLYIPELRIKQDLVPGAYTSTWFEANRASETALLCTEYCGSGHSTMMATVKVMEPSDYEKWLSDQGNAGEGVPSAELGKKLFVSRGCTGCHSTDGAKSQGPTLKGLFGRKELLESGEEVVVDENYVRESILKPATKVVRGYPPVMPTFQGLLKEREVDGLVAYLKTLGGE